MALRVWLPLNGNLNNQGLSNIIPSGTPTFLDNGKIGKCISLTPRVSFTGLPKMEKFTILFWLKVDSCTADWSDSLLFRDYTSAGTIGSGFRFEATTATRACSFHDNTGNAITKGSQILITSSQYGEWHHCGLSCDGQYCYTYIDGVLTYTNDAEGGYLDNYFHIGETDKMIGGMNDVRIYDECLSPKQVKEISKGLVAHYKLDNKYLEATTNLLSLETFTTNCYNGATNKYGYGENTDIYKDIGVFQGKKCVKIYMGTSGLSAKPYPYVSNLFVSNGTNQPAYKTLSFDYYGTIGDFLNPYKLGSGSGTCTWTNDSTAVKSGSFTNTGNIPVVLNKWQHITMTLHGTTDANSEWGYIIIGNTHTSDVNNYWLFANVQLETKDHETGYTIGTRSAQTQETDVSGNGYNGIISGTLSYNVDSPRHSGSTLFNGGANYIAIGRPMPTDELTVNVWAYMDNWANYNARLASCTEGGGWNFESMSGALNFAVGVGATSNTYMTNFTSSQTPLSGITSGWHMFTGTFDGINKKLYIDGVLKASVNTLQNGTTLTEKTPLFYNKTNSIFIGAEAASSATAGSSPYFTGSMSDFRIYATALTADEILTMYKTSGIIDNKGNVYAYEFKEE